MGKVQSYLQWGQNKGHWPEVLLHVKVQSSPVQHAAGLTCISSYSPLLDCRTQGPSWSLCMKSTQPWSLWLLRPHSCREVMCECVGQAWGPKWATEKGLLCSPEIIYIGVGKKQKCFSEWSTIFPRFCWLFIHLHTLVKLTGLFGLAPHCAPSPSNGEIL